LGYTPFPTFPHRGRSFFHFPLGENRKGVSTKMYYFCYKNHKVLPIIRVLKNVKEFINTIYTSTFVTV